MPESVYGELTSIVFELMAHEGTAVARAEVADSEDDGKIDAPAPTSTALPLIEAVTRVQLALERLRGTLRWVAAGVIISALALLAKG